MPSGEIESLLETVRQSGAASHRALGRLVRLVDDDDRASDSIDEAIKSGAFRAARVGLTGPPGGGKSTLIAAAIEILAETRKRIGILAVDPTSPFTGGALLGDRVRLKGPIGENVFFRSLASRGALGGVSNAIWPASRLLDWWGADIILIETVGTGQLGIAVRDVADLVVAVLTPETGDGIQSMKAGVMELADCFIVNKSDRPGSELMLKELSLVQEEARAARRSVKVFQTSALNGDGIEEATDGLAALWRYLIESGEISRRRVEQVRREVAFRTERRIQARMASALGGAEAYDSALSEWAKRILSGEATASAAAAELAR
jgi:LAO/AO transport system kinase